MTDLTPAEIDKLEARARVATPGPWHSDPQDGAIGHCAVAQVYDSIGRTILYAEPTPDPVLASTNASLVADLRNHILSLCAMARAKIAAQERVREAIDLLAERIYGNPARSPAHNARLVLERVLDSLPGEKEETDG